MSGYKGKTVWTLEVDRLQGKAHIVSVKVLDDSCMLEVKCLKSSGRVEYYPGYALFDSKDDCARIMMSRISQGSNSKKIKLVV